MVRIAQAAAAAVALLGLLAGVPWLLVTAIGNPWPAGGVSWQGPVTDGALIGLLAVVVWVLWAQLAVCVAVEAAAALSDDRVRLRAPLTFGVQQQLARTLVSAVVVATLAAPLVGGASAVAAVDGPGASATRPPPNGAGAAAPGTPETATTPPAPEAAASSGDAPRQHPQVATRMVTVMRLDTLWSIAERELGRGERWREIAALNEGRVMDDAGARFTTADHIEPGWQLRVPDETTPRATATTPATETTPERVTVQPGDTLSGIAQQELGDARRWPDLYRASRDTVQPDGRRITDPDMIDVGWRVTIPATPAEEATPDAAGKPQTQAEDQSDAAEGRHDETKTRPDAAPPPQPPPPEPTTRAPPAAGTPAPAEKQDSHAGAAQSEPPPAATTGTGAGEADQTGPWWMLPGLTGGGVVLAGGLLLGLRSRRRAQLRTRRPGRAVPLPPEGLAGVEKSVTSQREAAASVADLDLALRRLAADQADRRQPAPPVAAVELAGDTIVLHLTQLATLPTGWEDARGDGRCWRGRLATVACEAAPAGGVDAADPPYPMLVTAGHDPQGRVWLLNLEEAGELRVAGDPHRSLDWVRYLVAELAMNPWAQRARVDCVGVAAEVAELNPDRVTHHDPAAAENTAGQVLADAVATTDRAASAGVDAATGRSGQVDEDVWPARVLVLHAQSTAPDEAADSSDAAEDATLAQLRHLAATQPGRTGTAVVLHQDTPDVVEPGAEPPPGADAEIDTHARLRLPAVGLELTAVGLTAAEAHGCAALLGQAADTDDAAITADQTATRGWESYATHTGALRSEHTVPRDTAPDETGEPVSTVLEATEEDYVHAAAATSEDLAQLSPQVPTRVRAEVEETDPGLDAEVADWFDPNCRRPRLQLLGPVTARTAGTPLSKRKAYFTELLAYLTLRRRTGATPEEVAEAFGLETRKVRGYVNTVRGWLGADTETGEAYLPHADKAPAAQHSGVPVYQVSERVLLDVELFRRLRVRGEARGADGIEDLQHALQLVTGRPFDQLRDGGWTWLIDGDRLDLHMTLAVADVAFLVTTHSLQTGEIARARAAADIGALAAPDEEATRLSLARVAEAEGEPAEAERIVREDVCNRSEDHDPPPDVSERTQTIIANHGWLKRGNQTAS